MVLATVHNTGGRALDMNGTLQLPAGPGGLSAGPFPANLGVTLAIGDTGARHDSTRQAATRRPVGRTDHPAQRTARTQRTSNHHLPQVLKR